MSAQITFNPGDLGSAYCFSTWQTLYQDMISQLSGSLPGNFSTFNFGDTTPDADDQDKPWVKTDSGNLVGLYTFGSSGSWVRPHPVPAGGSVGTAGARILWTGAPGDIDTYDGGTAGVATATTGPFWEIDTALSHLIPIGVGTLPSGTVINVRDTSGAETVTLTAANLPPHKHGPDGTNTGIYEFNPALTGVGASGTGSIFSTPTTGDGAPQGLLSTPVNKMPLTYGVYFIKRTIRQYYTA